MKMKSYDAAQKWDQVIISVDPCLVKLGFIIFENTADHRPEVIILFLIVIQLSINFQSYIKAKMVKTQIVLALKLSDVVFILLIIVKTPTNIGISIYEQYKCHTQFS